jgi:hypothetical protein
MSTYNDLSKQISDLTGNENQASQDQIKALQGQYGYNDAYNNLQGVRRNVSDTQSALNALPEQLQQRTAGSLTTAGQLARLTTTESDPISKQLATLNQQQSLGQQGMTDIQNQINQGLGLWQQSYADRLSALQNQQSQAFQAQQADAAADAQQKAWNDYYASQGAGSTTTNEGTGNNLTIQTQDPYDPLGFNIGLPFAAFGGIGTVNNLANSRIPNTPVSNATNLLALPGAVQSAGKKVIGSIGSKLAKKVPKK